MSEIKKVALAGASGTLGKVILPALTEAGFQVAALVRKPGTLATPLPAGAHEVVVDYSSPASVRAALADGVDAVVCALGTNTGAATRALMAAAVELGTVRRFVPSGFGCDLERAEARTWAVFAEKLALQDELARLAAAAGDTLSWTSVSNNAFLDWGVEQGFVLDAAARRVTLWDGGAHPVGVTRLAAVARAVVGVLRRLDETRNRTVYVQEAAVSMRRLAEIVRELTPGKEWTLVEASTQEAVDRSNEALARGVVDDWVWIGYITRAAFGNHDGVNYVKNDNELLGVRELSEEELKEAIRQSLAKIPGVL